MNRKDKREATQGQGMVPIEVVVLRPKKKVQVKVDPWKILGEVQQLVETGQYLAANNEASKLLLTHHQATGRHLQQLIQQRAYLRAAGVARSARQSVEACWAQMAPVPPLPGGPL